MGLSMPQFPKKTEWSGKNWPNKKLNFLSFTLFLTSDYGSTVSVLLRFDLNPESYSSPDMLRLVEESVIKAITLDKQVNFVTKQT